MLGRFSFAVWPPAGTRRRDGGRRSMRAAARAMASMSSPSMVSCSSSASAIRLSVLDVAPRATLCARS